MDKLIKETYRVVIAGYSDVTFERTYLYENRFDALSFNDAYRFSEKLLTHLKKESGNESIRIQLLALNHLCGDTFYPPLDQEQDEDKD